MKLACVALLLLILIPSCTIEKRVHNRGWNVQWRKHPRFNKEKETPLMERSIAMEHVEQFSPGIEPVSIESSTEQEAIGSSEGQPVHDDVSDLHEVFYQEPEDTAKKKTLTVSPNADMSTSRDRRASPGRTSFPVTLIVLGLLGVLFAILLYFTISTLVDILLIFFSILLMIVLGIVGTVLMLVGLTVLLISLAR